MVPVRIVVTTANVNFRNYYLTQLNLRNSSVLFQRSMYQHEDFSKIKCYLLRYQFNMINFSYRIMSLLNALFGSGMKRFYEIYYFTSNPKNYKRIGKHVVIERPFFAIPSVIELESYTRIQPNVKIIASKNQRVIIKKFSAIGAGSTIIPGNHTPTVSLPQYLSYLGVNDINNTLVIEEDVWIGANSTLLYKANIGRGSVVAANSVVTKKVPPYAVVSGIPARIIAVRFSLDQIIEHEKHLYPESERLEESYLEQLFNNEYMGLKAIGTSYICEDTRKRMEREKKNIGIPDYY